MLQHRFTQRQLLTFVFLALTLVASAALAWSKFLAPPAQEALLDSPPVTSMGPSVAWP
jgi:hypothetical protein